MNEPHPRRLGAINRVLSLGRRLLRTQPVVLGPEPVPDDVAVALRYLYRKAHLGAWGVRWSDLLTMGLSTRVLVAVRPVEEELRAFDARRSG